jgi:hypothetical protein
VVDSAVATDAVGFLKGQIGAKQFKAVFDGRAGNIGTAATDGTAEEDDLDARSVLQFEGDGEAGSDDSGIFAVAQNGSKFERGGAGIENEPVPRLHELRAAAAKARLAAGFRSGRSR